MAYNWPAENLTVQEKVGVGTETPTEKLEVKGNLKLNAGVAVGEFSIDGTFAAPGNQSVPTTLAVKTYVDNQRLSINAVLDNKADKSGALTQDFQVNNLTAQSNLQVTGTVTANKFIGDGSGLTGVTQWLNSSSGSISYSGGNVGIGTATPQGKLEVNGDIRAGNSDLYFTKTDHKHSGFGNPTGFAAIENASDYGALMILGRAGTAKGRYVRLWDYLQVNGGLDITGNVGIGTETPDRKLVVRGGETSLQQEDWQTPTFQNGWVNYGGVFNPAGYFKDSLGIIHLRGLVKNGSGTIFTLPEGYRPLYQELHSVATNQNEMSRIDILTNGPVCMQKGNNSWLSLDGITFRAGSR